MSEHPPVTEEMVTAAATAGGYDAERLLKDGWTWRHIRAMLEAAQAVAPPKETADTKLRELLDLVNDGDMPDWGNTPQTDLVSRSYVKLAEAIDAAMREQSSPAAPATPSLLAQPTPTAYRHKNQLTGQWIYTESRCPSEWAERDGIVQEPLYLHPAGSTGAPLTLTDSAELTEEVRKIAAWLADEGVTHDLTGVRLSLAPLIAAARKSSSPSGASGTEETKK